MITIIVSLLFGKATRRALSTTALLLSLLIPVHLLASEQDITAFDKGNEAYSRGNYEQAITIFERLVSGSGHSAPLLYNLANSYAQNGQVGKAIVNYERASILAPDDADISGNLAKLRKESGLFQEQPKGTERLFALLTINQWAGLLLFTLAGLTFFLLAATRLRFSRSSYLGAILTGALLIVLSIAGIVIRAQHFNPSVVLSGTAKLLVSPFESSASVGTIQGGRLVYPGKTHGAYIHIQDAAGRRGWLEASQLESVCGEEDPG